MMRFYDLKRNWTRKIVSHLGDETLNRILVDDFNKYTFGRWAQEFKPGEFPHDYETCDWDLEHRGPQPPFWRYVKHSACHWLVNFNLRLAQLVMPQKQWRIITSDQHSTVWDGHGLVDQSVGTLFDFNFLALGVPPDQCFDVAYDVELPVGEYLNVTFADHYTQDLRHGLTEHDAESFRRRMTGLRDLYKLTDEMITALTPETITRFYQHCKQKQIAAD